MNDDVDNAGNGTDGYDGNDRKYDDDRKYVDEDDDVVVIQMILNYLCNKQ